MVHGKDDATFPCRFRIANPGDALERGFASWYHIANGVGFTPHVYVHGHKVPPQAACHHSSWFWKPTVQKPWKGHTLSELGNRKSYLLPLSLALGGGQQCLAVYR